jgi:hypothetical protein
MDEHERTFLREMRARLGGAAAGRAAACARCAEILRTKNGSHDLLVELRSLVGKYCATIENQADIVRRASAALRLVEGRQLTSDAAAKVVAAARTISEQSEPANGERAMLELWIRRPEIFSEALSRFLRERWNLLTGMIPKPDQQTLKGARVERF